MNAAILANSYWHRVLADRAEAHGNHRFAVASRRYAYQLQRAAYRPNPGTRFLLSKGGPCLPR